MYFQLEVEYYSNEANKNKYKNVQLIRQRKQLKDNCRLCWALCLQRQLVMLVAWTSSTLLLGLGVA